MHTVSSLCWVDGGGQGELHCLQAGGSLNAQQWPHLLLFLKHQIYQPKLFLLFSKETAGCMHKTERQRKIRGMRVGSDLIKVSEQIRGKEWN